MYFKNKNIKKTITHLMILFLISSIVRIVLSSPPPVDISGDSAEYLEIAKHLYRENKFSYDGKNLIYFRPPLYPFIISLLFHITGINMIALFYFNIFLNSLVPVIFFLILRQLRIKYSLSFLLSIFISFFNIFISSTIFTENLYNTLLLLSVYLILLSHEKNRIEFTFWSGVILGLTALTRPIALIILPATLISFKKPNFFLILSISTILTITPWCIRNSIISQKFSLIDNNLGYNLFVGNNPYKNLPPKFDDEFFESVKSVSCGKDIDNKKLRKFSIDYIINYPFLFIQKIPYKISRLFGSGITEILEFRKKTYLKNSILITFLINWGLPALISILFFFFLPYAFSNNKNFNFLIYIILSFAFVHAIFFGMPRYREPLIPFMLIIILYGVSRFKKINSLSLLLSSILIYYYLEELFR